MVSINVPIRQSDVEVTVPLQPKYRHILCNNGLHVTVCTLHINNDPVMYGAAFCSPTDNFSPREGRGLALARAIEGWLCLDNIDRHLFCSNVSAIELFDKAAEKVHLLKGSKIRGYFQKEIAQRTNGHGR